MTPNKALWTYLGMSANKVEDIRALRWKNTLIFPPWIIRAKPQFDPINIYCFVASNFCFLSLHTSGRSSRLTAPLQHLLKVQRCCVPCFRYLLLGSLVAISTDIFPGSRLGRVRFRLIFVRRRLLGSCQVYAFAALGPARRTILCPG